MVAFYVVQEGIFHNFKNTQLTYNLKNKKNMKRKGKLKKIHFVNKGLFFKNVWLICGLSFGLAASPMLAKAENSKHDLATDAQYASQQNRKINGNITDEHGEPLIGVSVVIKGTTTGTITDFDGNFSLDVSDNTTLQISYVGHKTKEITVGNQQKLEIILESDSEILDEVVVVGYGVVKKSDLTGSVGSISADAIASKGTTSVMESMQGKVAGVNISQSSSRVGEGFNIQIRGKSTINSSSEPLYVIDGIICDNMNFLNPMDIERVDVLKDASSTAIYGSRATNGVVMITTKKGDPNASRTSVSYDGYYGMRTTANMPDFMSGDEFLKFRFSRYLTSKRDVATGLTTWNMSASDYANFWGGDSPVVKAMYRDKNYTDWTDLVTRDGSQQNHFINISGNAKDISYRIGLGYQNEEGVMYDDYERWNIKGALDHKISDKVSVGFSTNLATAMKKYGSANSVSNGFSMTPVMPAFYWEGDKAGQPIYQPGKDAVIYPNGGGPTSTINPIVDRKNSIDNTRSYDAMANLYLQFSPIKEVILKTSFLPMYTKSFQGVAYGSETQNRQGKSNYAEKHNSETFSYTWDMQANYIKTFGTDHSLNAMALVSAYQQKRETDFSTYDDIPFDVGWHNTESGRLASKGSLYQKLSMLSYVARVNYTYKGKYLLTASSRWDGSSKFSKDNRWGMFPSMALAWRLSDEDFMESTKSWLSNLKPRFSFGVTGNNSGVLPYSTSSLADVNYYYNFGGSLANGFGSNLSNQKLKWEKTTELNAGFDYGFFNNRISGSVDIYSRNSKDVLLPMDTPLELGSNSGTIPINVGEIGNRGIELQLTTVNYQDKDWRWETSFTFARNINKLKKLFDKEQDLIGMKWFLNNPIDVVYGHKQLGIVTKERAQASAQNPKEITKVYEGEMEYYDRDGNGIINDDDRMILGHAAPTWTGSLNSNLTYKNLDFSFSIYTSQGGTVDSPFMNSFFDYSQRGVQRMKMDFYIPEGAPVLGKDGSISYQETTHYGSLPFPTNGTNGRGGGQYWQEGAKPQNFVDNSYVKVKNITVGYTFPKNWLQKAHISHLRVYANILNPFTFTDYKGFDPEWADAKTSDGAGGVSSRTFQFGVNLKF